jgi:hypothetical protein
LSFAPFLKFLHSWQPGPPGFIRNFNSTGGNCQDFGEGSKLLSGFFLTNPEPIIIMETGKTKKVFGVFKGK